MICTVINCHHPRPPAQPQADFIDPKTGKVLSTVYFDDDDNDENEAQVQLLGAKLTNSGKWKVIWSLSPGRRGLWKAVRLSLLDRNCPGWQERSRENAEANR